MATPPRPLNKRNESLIAEALKQQKDVYKEEQDANVAYEAALKNRKKNIGEFRDAKYKLGRAEAASDKYNGALIESIKQNAAAFEGIYDTWDDLIKANRRFESNMRQAGGDLRKSQRKNSQQGFQRQMMLQSGAQGANAIAELSTVNRLPVIGGAIQSAAGTAINAGLMNAGIGTAVGMGLLAGGGSLIAGGVANAYNQFESEEGLERQLGQRMGVGKGRGFIRDMRKQGLTREQIGGLGGGLSQTVGSTTEAVGVYQMQTAFGVNPMGAMGAMASTGRGSQLRMVQDAISIGMSQGLARGRFGEMVDGLQHLVRQQGVGVGVGGAELGGTLGYMGALGKGMGIQGSQFMNVMGQLDLSARGKTGGLSESISFLSGYNYLQAGGRSALEGLGSSGSGGAVTPFDVEELMERGSTGKGGMGRQQIVNMLSQYQGLAKTSKRDMDLSARKASTPEEQAETDAAKLRYQMMQKGLVTGGAAANMTVARQLTDSFLTNNGKIGEKDITAAQEAGKSQQDKAYDEIHEQTGLQQRIAYGIEALGRSMPGTGGAFNRTFEGLLSGMRGEQAGRYQTQLERETGAFGLGDLYANTAQGNARGEYSTGMKRMFGRTYANVAGADAAEAFNLEYRDRDLEALQGGTRGGKGGDFITVAKALTEAVTGTEDQSVSEETKAASAAAFKMLQDEVTDRSSRTSSRDPHAYVPSADSSGVAFSDDQKKLIANMIGSRMDAFANIADSTSPEQINSLATRLNSGEVQFPFLQRSEDALQFLGKRLQELQPLPGQGTR